MSCLAVVIVGLSRVSCRAGPAPAGRRGGASVGRHHLRHRGDDHLRALRRRWWPATTTTPCSCPSPPASRSNGRSRRCARSTRCRSGTAAGRDQGDGADPTGRCRTGGRPATLDRIRRVAEAARCSVPDVGHTGHRPCRPARRTLARASDRSRAVSDRQSEETFPRGTTRRNAARRALLPRARSLIVVVLYRSSSRPAPHTPKLGLDLVGGTQVIFTAKTPRRQDPVPSRRWSRRSRSSGSGSTAPASPRPTVVIQGNDQLVMSIPGARRPRSSKLEIAGREAELPRDW